MSRCLQSDNEGHTDKEAIGTKEGSNEKAYEGKAALKLKHFDNFLLHDIVVLINQFVIYISCQVY